MNPPVMAAPTKTTSTTGTTECAQSLPPRKSLAEIDAQGGRAVDSTVSRLLSEESGRREVSAFNSAI
jgi:hypothetical protein